MRSGYRGFDPFEDTASWPAVVVPGSLQRYRGFDPFEDTASSTIPAGIPASQKVTGGSIRLRILQVATVGQRGLSARGYRGFDPFEDTASVSQKALLRL